jgi:HEAT repeat protein
MTDKRLGRCAWLTLGAALVAITAFASCASVFGAEAPSTDSARHDSPAMAEVRQLQREVIKKKSLSPPEMAHLRKLTNDKDPFVRARALTALGGLLASPQAKDAAAIARSKLGDPDPLVRSYALRGLEKLKAPDLVAQARKLMNDPNARVRQRAAGIVSLHH